MKRLCSIVTLAAFVFLLIGTAVVDVQNVNAAEAPYTVYFFNKMDNGFSFDDAFVEKYKADMLAYDAVTYQNDIGYRDVLVFKTASGAANGDGFRLKFPSAIKLEKNRYVEIEFDFKSFEYDAEGNETAMKNQFKVRPNDAADMLNLFQNKKYTYNGSGTVQFSSITYAQMHRVKFVICYDDSTGTACWKMVSLYIDGEAAEGFEPRIGDKFTSDIENIKFRYEKSTDRNSATHIDNLSVVSYLSADGTSPVPDKYEMLKQLQTAQTVVDEAKTSESISNAAYSLICDKIAAEEAVFNKSNATVDELSESKTRLEAAKNMVEVYKKVEEKDPVTSEPIMKYYLDKENATVTGSLAENDDITVSMPVYVGQEPSVSVTPVGFLYSYDEDLHTPKLVDIIEGTPQSFTSYSGDNASLTIEASKYSAYSDVSVKAVFIENFAELTQKAPAGIVSTQTDAAIGDGYSFTENVNISKAPLNDEPDNEDMKVIVSLKGTPQHTVSMLVTKPSVEKDDIEALGGNSTTYAAATLNDLIEYYSAATFDSEGKAVFEFLPSEGLGYYNYLINSDSYTATVEGSMLCASMGDINDIFTNKLYVDEVSLSNVTEIEKDALSINTQGLSDAGTAGVSLDNVLKEVLAEDTYTAQNVATFTSSYLGKLNVVKNFRNSDSADTVMALIDAHAADITNLSEVTGLSTSKQRQAAYSYIYSDRSNIIDMATLNDSFADAKVYALSNGGGSGSGGGGGSSSGGGSGSGGGISLGSGSGSGAKDNNENDVSDGYMGDLKPAEPVQPNKTPMQNAQLMFNDIDDVSWAKTAIMEFSLNGWINGKADGVFAPNDKITREEFVKIAVNVFDIYNEAAECSFADTGKEDWHYKYIASAFNEKIINGVEDNLFGTGNYISRSDMAVIIYRIITNRQLELTHDGEYIPFADEELIDEYAKEAVVALTKSGIINGTDNNAFDPFGNATRAEAVKMLYGAYKLK